MTNKIIFLLLLSTILLVGCKSSSNASNKIPTSKDSVTTSPKASSTDAEKSATTNIIVQGKDTNVKLPPSTSNETIKVTDDVKSIVDSIDSVLSAKDETIELDLN